MLSKSAIGKLKIKPSNFVSQKASTTFKMYLFIHIKLIFILHHPSLLGLIAEQTVE